MKVKHMLFYIIVDSVYSKTILTKDFKKVTLSDQLMIFIVTVQLIILFIINYKST